MRSKKIPEVIHQHATCVVHAARGYDRIGGVGAGREPGCMIVERYTFSYDASVRR